MIKYPKIKRLGHRATDGILEPDTNLVITEKLDGNNFRWTYDEEYDKLVFGSRNVEFRKEGGTPMNPDDEGFGSQFRDAAKYVKNKVDVDELVENDLSRFVFFGENMVKHTLDYRFEEMPQWLCFDIYDKENERFVSRDYLHNVCKFLNLKAAPVKQTCKPASFKEQFDPDEPESVVPKRSEFRDGKPEGIVIRNEDNCLRAKVLTEEFKEKHRADSQKSQHGEESMPDDDVMTMLNTYVTDARVRKHIKKLTVDEGHDLEMELMEYLPMRVVEDVFEEEYEEIVRSRWTINFKKFRSKVAKKCVKLLRAEIRYQATTDEDDEE